MYQQSDVEFDGFVLELTWSVEGIDAPATETSPAESRFPLVRKCVFASGEVRSLMDFYQLSEELQQRAVRELLTEMRLDDSDDSDDIWPLMVGA